MATATTDPVRLPPGARIPKAVLGIAFMAKNAEMLFPLARRYGNAFTMRMPLLGLTVVVSDPTLVKDVFSTSTDLIERPASGPGSLSEAFGPGSTFSLAGDKLVARRKVVFPQFHGKRVQRYEHIVEEEVMREIATWPEGREFETMEPMTSITLGAILRAILGAEGPALDELRDLVPPMPKLAGLALAMPSAVRRDLGPWSPWGRYLRYRRRFNAIVDSLIADARADPALEERSDVLALLLRAHDQDGEPIPDPHIADELLSLVASGHETTASQLSWAVERLRRHPRLLSRLTEEADAGGSELRQATIWEVQRTRPVLDAAVRRTKTRIRLGDWVIPEDTVVLAGIRLAQASEDSFPEANSFNPDRFDGTVPKPFAWIPFGGGVYRCLGAGFANMEMDVVLRMLLREFRFAPTDAPGERLKYRGVAFAPARGGRAVVYRRTAEASGDADAASVPDGSRRRGNR
jgi:cytochrome P450